MDEAHLQLKKKTVLVVDDEPHIIELVKIALEEDGFSVVGVSSGEEGLRTAGEIVPDLILLDVILPELDGYEVCKRLKSLESTRAIPVLLLTSRGAEVDRQKGKASGADRYLTKPFSPLKLLSVVKESLKE